MYILIFICLTALVPASTVQGATQQVMPPLTFLQRVPAGIPDDLSFEQQVRYISAPPPFSPKSRSSPSDCLLEDDEYERFILDCNSPPHPTIFAALSISHLCPMLQPINTSFQEVAKPPN
jgi:hypothetical protein